MSKKSAYKIRQRIQGGIERERKVQFHVMKTQTEKIADLVGEKIRSLIVEEVSNELDRRGYPDRKNYRSTPEVLQNPGIEVDPEANESVEGPREDS
jgi:hypothetical protein